MGAILAIGVIGLVALLTLVIIVKNMLYICQPNEVLVFSGASIMCVASAIDPLRAANRIAGRTQFEWKLVSADGDAPVTTCGLPVVVSGRFDPASVLDMLVIIAGFGTGVSADWREDAAALAGNPGSRVDQFFDGFKGLSSESRRVLPKPCRSSVEASSFSK